MQDVSAYLLIAIKISECEVYISDKSNNSSLLLFIVTCRTDVQLAAYNISPIHVTFYNRVSQSYQKIIIALADKLNKFTSTFSFLHRNKWSIDQAFITRAAWSAYAVMNYCRPRLNTKILSVPDDPSYDYADLSQIRFSYVMFRHGSTIDRLAASGHRLLSSPVSVAWFACPSKLIASCAIARWPEQLARRTRTIALLQLRIVYGSSLLRIIHDSWESAQVSIHAYGILNFLYKLQAKGIDDTET